MSGQHYSLRWNNHQSHVLNAFDALLQTESLVDCTLVCEDTNVKAHKVVLSACSPYFQKIFTENPGKHPIIVLKDVRGWEVQCIVDFMYKGETSVPESQLNGLIKAAENLKVRGLTSNDQQLPAGLTLEASSNSHNGFHSAGRSSSSSRYAAYDHNRPPQSHSNHSSPISLNHHHEEMRARSPSGALGSGPRRKQARPRRRSGDSIGGSSMDLSKGDKSPTMNNNSANMDVDHNGAENLSLKRPSSSPAINLVKTETLLDPDARPSSSSDLDRYKNSPTSTSAAHSSFHSPMDKAAQFAALAAAAQGNGLHHAVGEHEARVEALQALNFMAAGGGLPPFPHPGLAMPPSSVSNGISNQHHPAASVAAAVAAAAAAAAAAGQRPTSTGTTPSSAFSGRGSKGQHSAPRGGPPRSWTNDDLTKALENVWNKRMTTSQASRVFGIPYNSLLMYVRGKYGKSLKLDVLKQKTPAANDNLNTIGNSRSTPKDKLGVDRHHPYGKRENGRRYDSTTRPSTTTSSTAAFNPYSAVAAAVASPSSEQTQPQTPSPGAGFNSFPNALFHNLPGLQEQMGLLGILPHDSSRMRELLQNIHREQQNALHNRPSIGDANNDSPVDEPKHVSSSQDHVSPSTGITSSGGGGLLMLHSGRHPGSVGSDIRSMSRSPMTSEQSLGSGSVNGEEDQTNEEEPIEIDDGAKERQVQELLIKAKELKKEADNEKEDKDDDKETDEESKIGDLERDDEDNEPREPSPVSIPNAGGEISAL